MDTTPACIRPIARRLGAASHARATRVRSSRDSRDASSHARGCHARFASRRARSRPKSRRNASRSRRVVSLRARRKRRGDDDARRRRHRNERNDATRKRIDDARDVARSRGRTPVEEDGDAGIIAEGETRARDAARRRREAMWARAVAAGPRTGRDGEAKGEGEKKTTRVERGEDGMMDTAMEVGDGGDGAGTTRANGAREGNARMVKPKPKERGDREQRNLNEHHARREQQRARHDGAVNGAGGGKRGGARDLEDLIARVEDAEDAAAVERVLRQSVFKPGAPAYTTVIKACGKASQWEKALKAYEMMTKLHGAKPNTITFSALINALGKAKQCDRAFQIFGEMNDRGIEPNIFTYSALLGACARAKQYQRAMDIFQDLIENHRDVEVDRITYGAAIQCCVQGRRADKAIEIFERMLASGIKGNIITYNAVLMACEKSGDSDGAQEMFERMSAEQVPMDRATFHAMIGACDRARQLSKVMDYYHMMPERGVTPDAGTVSNVLMACSNAKDPLTAIKVYNDARAKFDVHRTPGMFNNLIGALHRGKRYDLVYEQLFHDSMTQSALSVSTYVHLMMACERFGNWEKSFQLFEEFKRHSPSSVDSYVWTRVFYACGRFESDDPVWKNGAIPGYTSPTLQRAQATMRALWAEYKSKLSVFKEISAVAARVSRAGSNHPSAQSDVDASLALASAKHSELAQTHEAAPAAESAVEQEFVQLINAYRSAAAAAARCSDPSTVLDILRTCEYDGIPQDSVIYGAFVAALALNGDRVGANEKFREMFTLGLQPGVAVYAALARAAARAGDANTALSLAEDVRSMVGSSVGDGAIIDAVVAACEAGGDWTRGASLFTMWAANGVQGANDELRRAIAASSGLDPGPTRRGTSVYNAFRREPPAESQGVAAPRDAKTTTLTAKVQPFVPRGRPSVLRDDAKSSESKSPPDEGENPPDEAL